MRNHTVDLFSCMDSLVPWLAGKTYLAWIHRANLQCQPQTASGWTR